MVVRIDAGRGGEPAGTAPMDSSAVVSLTSRRHVTALVGCSQRVRHPLPERATGPALSPAERVGGVGLFDARPGMAARAGNTRPHHHAPSPVRSGAR
ncbi:hypothetical protein ACQEU5_03330 [Marinactinospora thermotolerans]|uniref:Uncharacterized protein n=1 Tax=Marinactinospora thermotolerans DSM 45154 TaxID=1122192 RepID=A0A1T4LEC7_9ACTN|nr:hypothetical protein [Marinactinospora thermotolerans]SJZ53023.1 hypothetical protein SAMN02745673_00641 [Marinactinospora thermotolerans DSM 45154]